MAVERDLIMAIKIRSDETHTGPRTLNLANTDQVNFTKSQIELPASTKDFVPIDSKVSDWANYFRCGLIVGQRYLMGVYDDELALENALLLSLLIYFPTINTYLPLLLLSLTFLSTETFLLDLVFHPLPHLSCAPHLSHLFPTLLADLMPSTTRTCQFLKPLGQAFYEV